MRVGILGYGKIGKLRHEVLKSLYPNTTYSIFDPLSHTDLTPEQVVDNSDVVFICSPNFKNVEYTTLALSKDKHVFCEKPPARSYNELLQVKETYKSDRTLIYGFNHRQYDSVKRIKSAVDQDEFGKILWLRGRYGKNMSKELSSTGWRMDYEKSGGGILLDQGIHMLDLMIFLTGGFDKVQSIVTNNLWDIEGIEDNVFVNLYNSEKNISASLHSTMIEWRHLFSLEVLFERGYMSLNGLKTPSGSYGREVLTICNDKHNTDDISTEQKIEYKNNTTWESEVSLFMESVINNENRSNLEDALNVMKLIREVYEN
jgi:1,5-anhydro-D-fructose reductase (1,5-anhydro-D-mannitol-forming)